MSPFKWLSPFGGAGRLGRRRRGRPGVHHIRARFSGRRQRIAHGPPLPPAVLRQLQTLIVGILDLDPGDPAQLASARGRVSPLTFAVLTCVPLERPSWLRTVRPDTRQVTEAVHHVMDDLGVPRPADTRKPPSVDAQHGRGT
jgi:hypothetical protein